MKFCIKQLTTVEHYADAFMHPLMVYLLGVPGESPQRTHRWNYQALTEEALESLPDAFRQEFVVVVPINTQAGASHWFGVPLLHLTRWGGWRDYVVIEPVAEAEWHVGWWTVTSAGISRLPLSGPVRMLCGPQVTVFFGVRADGTQIQLRKVGQGRVGDQSHHRLLPLL